MNKLDKVIDEIDKILVKSKITTAETIYVLESLKFIILDNINKNE